MNIYELYGRLTETHHAEIAQHQKTVALLRSVCQGDIDPTRVRVEGSSWRVEPVTPVSLAEVAHGG